VGLQCALEIVKAACEREDKRWATLPADLRLEAENVFMPNMAEQVLGILSTFNKGLASLVDVESLPEDSILHRLFDRIVYPYFRGADVFRRTHDKPRGYAGDYEMMNQVYRDGYEGKDLFSRVLHHYGTIEECGESVKFRRPYLQQHLADLFKKEGLVSALAIASGPAVECQSLVKDSSQENLDRLELTLFDLDREALEHAQTKLYETAMAQDKTVQCHFVNDSVKAFLSSDYAMEGNYDLIYSAGLFDYLDQKTATVLVHKFFRLLSNRGKLVVGNFTKANQSKAFLTLLCHWKLVHRTPEEMTEWAKGLPDCTVRIETDPGMNLAFVVIERKG
jgi:extracellular factor (EF) 3-hydroxypalmitic acid methyl ester biosynthesis protein